MNPTDQAGPLSGLRILDFTTMMSGPLATRLFADMAASVVKIEAPSGDHNRGRTPTRGEMSRYFAQLNAGKQSMVLNLKDPTDLAIARRLATVADVVIENSRPGVMTRLGLGFDELRELNPDLVYCSISGYGQSGPSAGAAAYAPNLHAASGFDIALMRYQERERQDKPGRTAIFIADVVAALYASIAIEAALLRRARTGAGAYIDLSLFDGMLNMMIFELQDAQTEDENRRSTYGPMPTCDGRFVSVAPVSQKQFEALLPLIGRADWLTDPNFATAPRREWNWDQLMQAVATWTVQRPAAECLRELQDAGLAASLYRTPEEIFADDHVRMRGVLAPWKDAGGDYFLVNAPFAFDDGSVHLRGGPPLLDEHRGDILRDWLETT